MMNILLFPNFRKKETLHALEQVLEWAMQSKAKLYLPEKTIKKLPSSVKGSFLPVPAEQKKAFFKKCDLLLSIGGDGTLLSAAPYSAEYGLPLAGINTGTLGFLSDILPEEIPEKLGRILSGDCLVEPRFTMQASWPKGNVPLAMNDIVLRTPSGGLAAVDVLYGTEVVSHLRADGLILATPTGSSAYGYAAGGPIIHPNAEVLSIIPICPQYRMNMPLLCKADRPVTVRPSTGTLRVIADGDFCGTLSPGQELSATQGKRPVRLVRFSEEWGILSWQERISKL